MGSFYERGVDAAAIVGPLTLAQLPQATPAGLSLRSQGPGTDPAYVVAPTRLTFVGGTPATWAAMPAADTEMDAAYRQAMGLGGFSRFRVVAHLTTPGFAGSYVRLKYSLNNGVAWSACGTSTANLSLTTGGPVFGEWVAFATGAKADVLLSIFGQDGNGAVGPVFGALAIEVI